MINRYIPNISRIEFSVTYACTGHCAHCSVGDRLHTSGHLSSQAAFAVVKDLCSNYRVDSVMTFGGEPLLFPDTVSAIHTAALQCGITKRQLITTAFFSTDHQKIAAVAAKLAASGINDLLLSVDAFHQAHIPLEPVLTFVSEIRKYPSVRLRTQPAWLVNREHNNPYNIETERLLSLFAEHGIPSNEGNDIFLEGNAEKNLAQYYPQCSSFDPDEKCGTQPYTSPLNRITSLSIDPNGDVIFCCFKVGNIFEKPILTILEKYDPYSDPAMAALLNGGIKALADYTSTCKDNSLYSIDTTKIHSACGLCRAIAAIRNRLDRSC